MFWNSLRFYALIVGGTVIAIFVPYYFIKKRKAPVQDTTEDDAISPINRNNERGINDVGPENSYLQRITSDNWETVGKVKNLYIYPLEGGSKFSVKKMHCCNFGFAEINGDGSPLRDRSFVVYSVTPYTNQKNAILEDPNLSVVSIKQVDSLITFSSPDTDLEASVKFSDIFLTDTTKVNYGDGIFIDVNDCGDEVSTFITTIVKNPSETMPRALRMGLYTSPARGLKHHNKGEKLENEIEKNKHSIEALLPKNSACTLVNEASVTTLREEITNNSMTKSELTHDFFRPHIVISGDLEKYGEDRIKAIKIGSAVLSNKLPCIYSKNVNINPATGELTLDEQPYNTLSKFRPLANVYSQYTSLEPTFGINMKVIHEAPIAEGDSVGVQWDDD